MSYLESGIESLIFCSPKPLKIEEIIKVFDEVKNIKHDKLKIKRILSKIIEKYKQGDSPFEVVESGGGFQFLTKKKFSDLNEILLKQRSKRRLTLSSLETLSIVAYKQPVTKSEIEEIRGVNCDYAIQKLLDKGLISINGKSEGIGRPLIYITSEKFMDYFGINNLDQLPTITDFREEENSIGYNEEV